MAEKNTPEANTVKLPCGCVYQDKSWLLTRISECELHKRKRTSKRPYRQRAECVRPEKGYAYMHLSCNEPYD